MLQKKLQCDLRQVRPTGSCATSLLPTQKSSADFIVLLATLEGENKNTNMEIHQVFTGQNKIGHKTIIRSLSIWFW